MKDWWDTASANERKGYLKSLHDQTHDFAKPMLGKPLLGIITRVEEGTTSVVTVVVKGSDGKPFVDEIRWPPKVSAERNGKVALPKTRKPRR